MGQWRSNLIIIDGRTDAALCSAVRTAVLHIVPAPEARCWGGMMRSGVGHGRPMRWMRRARGAWRRVERECIDSAWSTSGRTVGRGAEERSAAGECGDSWRNVSQALGDAHMLRCKTDKVDPHAVNTNHRSHCSRLHSQRPSEGAYFSSDVWRMAARTYTAYAGCAGAPLQCQWPPINYVGGMGQAWLAKLEKKFVAPRHGAAVEGARAHAPRAGAPRLPARVQREVGCW